MVDIESAFLIRLKLLLTGKSPENTFFCHFSAETARRHKNYLLGDQSAALLLEQPDQPLFLRLRLIHLLGFDGIALSPASE